MTTVGILHPGQMGVTVGATTAAGDHRTLWASEGRSESTSRRAAEAGFEDVGSVASLCTESDVVLAICPPHAAREQAREVMDAGFRGIYVDANAIAPDSALAVGEIVESRGATFVDGGIIGPPAKAPGSTRLYVSGKEAPGVAALFAAGPMEARVVDDRAGSASALKMTYAAWTKGSDALLLAIRGLAKARGVEDALVEEWNLSQAGLVDRSENAASANAFKAWRFEGEMQEIADTFESTDLPDGFHRAAADVYGRLTGFKDASPAPDLETVLKALLRR